MKQIFFITIISLVLNCFQTQSLRSQNPVVMFLKQSNEFASLPDKSLKYIYSYNFQSIQLEEESKPDTIIKLNGQEFQLFLVNSSFSEFISPLECRERSYDKSGKLLYTTINAFNESGKLIGRSTDFGDSPASEIMNSTLRYSYDSKQRLSQVTEKNAPKASIFYKDEMIVDSLFANIGIAKLSMKANYLNDSIFYIVKSEVDPELGEMFKELSKANEDLFTMKLDPAKKLYKYYSYKKREEKFQLLNIETLDQFANLIEEVKYNPEDGTCAFHKKYLYNSKNQLVEESDISNDTKLVRQYNEKGNIILKEEEFSKNYYIYDDKGNLIYEYSMNQEGDSMNTLTSYTNVYK